MKSHQEFIHWIIQAQTVQPGIWAYLGIMWREIHYVNDHSPRARVHTLKRTESSMRDRNLEIKDLTFFSHYDTTRWGRIMFTVMTMLMWGHLSIYGVLGWAASNEDVGVHCVREPLFETLSATKCTTCFRAQCTLWKNHWLTSSKGLKGRFVNVSVG